MPEKFRRYFLKAKEADAILNKAAEKLKVDLKQIFKAKVDVELVQTEDLKVYLVNSKPLLAAVGEDIVPTLTSSEFLTIVARIVVDMRAVPHICNGANVMAPGIVRYEGDFSKGDLVFIVDEKYGKPLALGEIMCDAETARTLKQGVIVRNIHHVGDKVWNLVKRLT